MAARLATYPTAPAAILGRLGGLLPAADAPRENEAKLEPDLTELFFAASTDERRLILTNLDAVVPSTARQRLPVSGDVIGRLETAALQHNASEFCRTLERALGISRALAERIARDPYGEPIVVAAKALGMKASVLQRILLVLNPQIGQSVERVYDLARLYDDLTPAAAERMLAIWRQAGGSPKPRHEPLYWDDERPGARSHATHAGHRVARGRETPPSRIKSNER